ncbi:hypothetical protein EZ428_12910 [Pedobacter frigiditerrae]|uniref:Uncharacterized protein n=1 Tax=Pedobacter frigiditerrae TaxID=2530452 RepID=A0A4R0MT17_9SPHI|nr:hypothetical protein [Pedobacter frigiditerrae]TCC90179.1 hypothetical protein EZ428_12910 [Pedobacter frigiditerrae]
MDVLSESRLSTELQELYLQNKEWMSHVSFLEDENRFFQKLFGQKLFIIGKSHTTRQINLISESLASLYERTVKLKNLIIKHQHLLEDILKDAEHTIGLNLIEEHATITAEVQELLLADRLMKSKLFMMVEGN